MAPTYVLRFFFDWQCESPLWTGNDAARAAFDVYVDLEALPLSEATRAETARVSAWHDTSLNWESPTEPGPWTQEEEARFDAAADALLEWLRRELGDDFEIVDHRH